MRRLVLLLVFCCTLPLAADDRPVIPTLTVEGDDGNVALELTAVTIRATIRGHLARTELELTYRSALDRVSRGEFSFPLPPDAEVSDVGLWFGETLRHGVAVERTLARHAYEESVHRAADPALVEWAPGHAFTLDVYPIPAGGVKKVFVAYDQELTSGDYVLDVRYAGTIAAFDLTVDAEGREVARMDGVVRVAREPGETALVARADDGAWYASAAIDVAPPDRPAPPASHVVILYDTSSSSVRQNAASVRRFLIGFLARQKAWATADLVPFHITLDPPRRIEKAATPSGALELERHLRELQPLGATNFLEVTRQLPKLLASLPIDTRVVLVTDGLTSLGDSHDVSAAFRALTGLRRPLVLLNAANAADDLLLDNAAGATGGWHVDLTRTAPEAAVAAVMQVPASVRFDGRVVPEVLLTSSPARFTIAARADRPIATFPATLSRALPLRELQSTAASMVRRAYARAKLRDLLARGAAGEDVIAHGRAYSQVTPRTSLLVLESWRDYALYHLDPPADLVEQMRRDQEQERLDREAEARRQEELRELRNQPLVLPSSVVTGSGWSISGHVYDEGGSALPGVIVRLIDSAVSVHSTVTGHDGAYAFTSPITPEEPTVRAELHGYGEVSRSLGRTIPSGASLSLILTAAVSQTITVTAAAPLVEVTTTASAETGRPSLRVGAISIDPLLRAIDRDGSSDSDDPDVQTAVALRRRELTQAVLAKMRAIRTPADRMRYYIAARGLLGGDKSFHIFAAEIFRERSPELALRVLLDLAEARDTDAPLLRLLARVIDGWNEAGLAKLLLQRALELAPDQVQSSREMILLDARQGRAEAVNARGTRLRAVAEDDREWGVVGVYEQTELALKRWEQASPPERQRGIDLRVDPEDDLTIELMFDTGWSWVDVHVIEPSGERVTWNHTKSAAGATFTGGFNYGYGPEIYTIRNAPRGTYRVEIDYYSSDQTNVSLETLAHVIIAERTPRGAIERRELFVVLAVDEEHRVLTTIER